VNINRGIHEYLGLTSTSWQREYRRICWQLFCIF